MAGRRCEAEAELMLHRPNRQLPLSSLSFPGLVVLRVGSPVVFFSSAPRTPAREAHAPFKVHNRIQARPGPRRFIYLSVQGIVP